MPDQGAHPASCSIDNEVLWRGVKRPEYEVYHSLRFCARDKHDLGYTYNVLHGVERDFS